MRPSLATVAALVAASIVTLSSSPLVSAAPAVLDHHLAARVGPASLGNRLPYKINKRDDDDDDDDDAGIDFNALASADYDSSDQVEAAQYGSSPPVDTAADTAADIAAGPPAEPGSAPESWDVALNMNPNDLPLLNEQSRATTTTAANAVQIGAPTDVNVDGGSASTVQQVEIGAPTDVNIDGTTIATATNGIEIGAPTDVNVDGTTTGVSATPTQDAGNNNGGNNNGGNNNNIGDFECLEVVEDCNFQCKDVQSIDESQFSCTEDIDFGRDYVCTDVDGNEFDCEPIDGQTAGGSNGGGSGSDPTYGGGAGNPSDGSDAAGLASSAKSSWTSGVIKTGVATAFVLVASAAFLL